MAKKLISDRERFFRNSVYVESGCLEWQLTLDEDGYGHFRIGSYIDKTRRSTGAHRWAYEEFVGPIPDGLVIDHVCQNKCCVNVEHLQVVTPLRNSQLAAERGNYNFPRKPHTEETKEKIRAKHIGMKASAEACAKMSLSRIGNKNSLGHKQTKEHKEKHRANSTKRQRNETGQFI